MVKFDYLFNFKFTRPDEDNKNVYEIGLHVMAADQASATRSFKAQNEHLTVLSFSIFAIYDEHGEHLIYDSREQIKEEDIQCCGTSTLPTCCEEHSVRFALLNRSVYYAEYAKFLLKNEPMSGWRDETQSANAFAKEGKRS